MITARAQNNPQSSEQVDDVVRVNTELVQTDAAVFDKAGRFVDGLQKEQFELFVDGKPQPISFFDLVKAGSASEEAQIAAARGVARAVTVRDAGSAGPIAPGRTIFFVVDDLHLAMENTESTRKLLLNFIDTEMAQNDQVAIFSTSGDIGLLEQLTGDKNILRSAVARINFRSRYMTDIELPAMSEFQAYNIIERNHGATLSYFMEMTMREYHIIPGVAAAMVRERARTILQKSSIQTLNTLSSLEFFARSAEQVPGRKLVFFISDGFYLTNTQTIGVSERMRRITDAAARANVVIYTMDARGLFSGMPDASRALGIDIGGSRSAATAGQIYASQEPLKTLAAETGGRALVNTNALELGLDRILEETSVYYLLAWRPSVEGARATKFRRIEARIKGRPDLSVRMRKGFFEEASALTTTRRRGKDASRPRTSDDELLSALRSFYPRRTLAVSLNVGYINDPDKGMVLAALMEVNGEGADTEGEPGAPRRSIDAVIAVFDDKAKYISGFKQQLVVNQSSENSRQPARASYSQQFNLTPGLYQVRVAARDARTGRTGSAIEWVEIPDLKRGRFSMSSLFIGEREGAGLDKSASSVAESMLFQPRRLLARGSRLGFVTYIYNATSGTQGPDVALQVQVFRADQPVITIPLRRVKTDANTDLKRIPYAAEVNVSQLPMGRYVLQVTAIDRTSKTTTSQQINFEVI